MPGVGFWPQCKCFLALHKLCSRGGECGQMRPSFPRMVLAGCAFGLGHPKRGIEGSLCGRAATTASRPHRSRMSRQTCQEANGARQMGTDWWSCALQRCELLLPMCGRLVPPGPPRMANRIEEPEYVCEVSGSGTDTDRNTGRILTLVVVLFSLLAVHDCQ